MRIWCREAPLDNDDGVWRVRVAIAWPEGYLWLGSRENSEQARVGGVCVPALCVLRLCGRERIYERGLRVLECMLAGTEVRARTYIGC